MHILNIVARVLLAQFGPKADTTAENLEEALGTMMAGLEVDGDDASDDEGEESEDEEEGEDGEAVDDNVLVEEVDVLVRGLGDLSDEEREELKEAIVPLKQLLKKVCVTHHFLPCPSSSLVPQLRKLSNSILIGDIFGMILFGLCIDKFGRKIGIVLTTLFLVLVSSLTWVHERKLTSRVSSSRRPPTA